jgi:hypothetical protein
MIRSVHKSARPRTEAVPQINVCQRLPSERCMSCGVVSGVSRVTSSQARSGAGSGAGSGSGSGSGFRSGSRFASRTGSGVKVWVWWNLPIGEVRCRGEMMGRGRGANGEGQGSEGTRARRNERSKTLTLERWIPTYGRQHSPNSMITILGSSPRPSAHLVVRTRMWKSRRHATT